MFVLKFICKINILILSLLFNVLNNVLALLLSKNGGIIADF